MKRSMLAIGFLTIASVASLGCGGEVAVSAMDSDAGPHTSVHQTLHEDIPRDAAVERVKYHDGPVLRHMRLLAVYFDEELMDPQPFSRDDEIRWLFTSSFWDLLGQYEVDHGQLVASIHLPRESMFGPGRIALETNELEAKLSKLLESESIVQAGHGFDSTIFFLPENVVINFGISGSYTSQTCLDVWGYHGYNHEHPMAILPACAKGRSMRSISHELAETAVNPDLRTGYFSDLSFRQMGSEIADFCPGTAWEGGYELATYWSNADGQCMPK